MILKLLQRLTAYVAASLSTQLVLTLAVALLGMGSIGLWIVRSSVEPVFTELERRNAYESVHRVMAGVQTELNTLQLLASDWASWSDLADFSSKGWSAFPRSNLTPAGLRKLRLTAMVVWDAQGQLVLRQHSQEPERGEVVMQRLSGLYQSMRAVGAQGCGFLKVKRDVMELCWERVASPEYPDHKVGTLALARVADSSVWHRIASETQESLEVIPAVFRTTGQAPAATWFVSGLPTYARQELVYTFAADALHLTVTLLDLRGIPLLDIRIQRPRDLAQEASHVVQRIFWQLVISSILVTLLVWLLVRWRLVGRIVRVRQQLTDIEDSKNWGRGLFVPGSDELGNLVTHINNLLRIIQTQVEDLTTQSQTDALTGLPNRRALEVYLQQELALAQRRSSSLSLLMLDVDFFKQYNDYYGHPSGDAVLQRIAHVLTEQCHNSGLVVRMGGEEFAILLPHSDAASAMRMAEQVRQAVEQAQMRHLFSAVSNWVTTSVGVTTMAAEHWSRSDFLRQADQALYAAKAGGRNSCVHFKDVA